MINVNFASQLTTKTRETELNGGKNFIISLYS
jgi:hypothetical protein